MELNDIVVTLLHRIRNGERLPPYRRKAKLQAVTEVCGLQGTSKDARGEIELLIKKLQEELWKPGDSPKSIIIERLEEMCYQDPLFLRKILIVTFLLFHYKVRYGKFPSS